MKDLVSAVQSTTHVDSLVSLLPQHHLQTTPAWWLSAMRGSIPKAYIDIASGSPCTTPSFNFKTCPWMYRFPSPLYMLVRTVAMDEQVTWMLIRDVRLLSRLNAFVASTNIAV